MTMIGVVTTTIAVGTIAIADGRSLSSPPGHGLRRRRGIGVPGR
jgi:hypothetical protein